MKGNNMIGRKRRQAWRIGCIALVIFAVFGLIPGTALAAMAGGGWELDGFVRNNTGTWTENWDYSPNNDLLATCRNWFRLNLNGKNIKFLKIKS